MTNDVVTLTESLVAVDTAPGCSTVPLAGRLLEHLQGLGAATALQQGEWGGQQQANLVARLGGDGPAGLILAGHLDTVPWQPGNRAT
jgi:acetylornithine deacetylase